MTGTYAENRLSHSASQKRLLGSSREGQPLGGTGSAPGSPAQEDQMRSYDVESATKENKAAHTKGLVSGFCYAMASTCMVLMNKHVLSSFGFQCTNMLLLYQTVWCVVLVKFCEAVGWIRLEKMTWPLVKTWLPVNFIFVGMIWSSFFSLKYLGVAMITVLKQATNLLVVFGDIFIFQQKHPLGVWISLVLMIASAVAGAATDLSFTWQGYVWQFVNCLFTAAYSLYLRFVMSKVAMLTAKQTKLDEFSMVLFNNVLSIPLILVLVVYFDELPQFLHEPALSSPEFLVAATGSGLLGFAISFTSLWFLHETSPTTYSLVGSLNKIPTALAGLVLFRAPTNVNNLVSIFVGLLAGVAFTYAKLMDGR